MKKLYLHLFVLLFAAQSGLCSTPEITNQEKKLESGLSLFNLNAMRLTRKRHYVHSEEFGNSKFTLLTDVHGTLLPGETSLLKNSVVTIDWQTHTLAIDATLVDDKLGLPYKHAELLVGRFSQNETEIIARRVARTDDQGHFALTVAMHKAELLFVRNKSNYGVTGALTEFPLGANFADWNEVPWKKRLRYTCSGEDKISLLKEPVDYTGSISPGATPLLQNPRMRFDSKTRSLSVSGVLIDDNAGKPYKQATVSVGKISDDHNAIVPRGKTQSDEKGRFELTVVPEQDDVLFICNDTHFRDFGAMFEYPVASNLP